MIRLGPGPTLLGTPDTGLDDETYQKFTHDTFGPEATREIPGVESTDPDRFAVRSRYLAGVGRMPWLTWRSKEIAALYAELNAVVQTLAPTARLAVVTPGLDGGPAGREARRVDRAALPPCQSWRSVGFDLQPWPSGPDVAAGLARNGPLDRSALARPGHQPRPRLAGGLAADRGLLLSIGGADASDDLGGTSPGADAPEDRTPQSAAAGSAPRVWLTALPLGDGPAADEPLGHALAALDSRWVFLAEKAVSGQEERLRRFARVLCALPAADAPAELPADAISKPFGVVVRTLGDSNKRSSRSPTTHHIPSGWRAGSTCPQGRRSKTSVVGFVWLR